MSQLSSADRTSTPNDKDLPHNANPANMSIIYALVEFQDLRSLEKHSMIVDITVPDLCIDFRDSLLKRMWFTAREALRADEQPCDLARIYIDRISIKWHTEGLTSTSSTITNLLTLTDPDIKNQIIGYEKRGCRDLVKVDYYYRQYGE